MRIRSIIIIFCLLSSIAVQIHSQQVADSIFATYFARSQAYADAYPREKAYLHLDNTSYYIGDTIWYKAYVVTAEQNQPSPISTPLYVELLDTPMHIHARKPICTWTTPVTTSETRYGIRHT